MTGCQGQDWASYQDWSPSTAGLSFVLIKATEGGGYVNPRYASQLAAARAGAVVPGHYHFARPGGMQAQADFFLRKISLRPGDVIALDWEDPGVSSDDKDAWIKYVQAKAPGHQVLLYCNRDFWLNRDTSGFAGDGLWIADPDAPMGQPRVKSPYVIHQYSEVGGIDRDYSPLTPADFAAWAHAKENTDMPLTDADAQKVVNTLLTTQIDDPRTSDNSKTTLRGMWWYTGADAAQANATIKAQAATIQTLAGLVNKDVDTATVVSAVQKAIADAVVNVHVDVTGQPTA